MFARSANGLRSRRACPERSRGDPYHAGVAWDATGSPSVRFFSGKQPWNSCSVKNRAAFRPEVECPPRYARSLFANFFSSFASFGEMTNVQ